MAPATAVDNIPVVMGDATFAADDALQVDLVFRNASVGDELRVWGYPGDPSHGAGLPTTTLHVGLFRVGANLRVSIRTSRIDRPIRDRFPDLEIRMTVKASGVSHKFHRRLRQLEGQPVRFAAMSS